MNFAKRLKCQIIIGVNRFNMFVNKPGKQFIKLLQRISTRQLNKTIVLVRNIAPVIHVRIFFKCCVRQHYPKRKVGIGRRIIENAGYFDGELIYSKRFADCGFPITKIFRSNISC